MTAVGKWLNQIFYRGGAEVEFIAPLYSQVKPSVQRRSTPGVSDGWICAEGRGIPDQ